MSSNRHKTVILRQRLDQAIAETIDRLDELGRNVVITYEHQVPVWACSSITFHIKTPWGEFHPGATNQDSRPTIRACLENCVRLSKRQAERRARARQGVAP